MKEIQIKCQGADWLSIDQLTHFQGNLKTLSEKEYKKLRNSIERHGFSFPIFVWKNNGSYNIIDGHQRLFVVKKMVEEGWFLKDNLLPVDWIEARDEKEAKEKVLLAASQYGLITPDSLYEFINLENLNFGDLKLEIDLPQIDLSKFERDFVIEEDEKADEVPPIPEEPKTKRGDLYILGEHRVLCGDATSKEDIEKLMYGKKGDLLTDPPYNVGFKYNLIDDNKPNFMEWCHQWFDLSKQYWERAIIFIGNYNLKSWIKEFDPDYIGIWDKSEGAISTGYITKFTIWEPIFFHGSFKRIRHNDIFRYLAPTSNKKIGHPCPKPISLIIELINFFCDNKIILDLFLGSGTTLIACEKTNRICYGMEIDPLYCDVIVKRWEDYTGKKAVLVNE